MLSPCKISNTYFI